MVTTPSDQPTRLASGPLGAKRCSAAWLYVLRLTSGMLHIGVTYDLEQRWVEHVAGKASRLTSQDPPNGIVYREPFDSLGEARTRERKLKRWTRAKKEALVGGDLLALRGLSRRRGR